MPTEKQLAANRTNARSSTGPKSVFGKFKSSINATKHGVYSVRTLFPGEDAGLYEEVLKEQRKRFKPKTFVEKALVDQLMAELWRLRRISRAEFLLGLEIQAHLQQTAPIEFDKDETTIYARIKRHPEEMFEHFKKYVEAVKKDPSLSNPPKDDDAYITSQQLKMLARLNAKIARVDMVYSDMFVSSSHEKMQKIIF